MNMQFLQRGMTCTPRQGRESPIEPGAQTCSGSGMTLRSTAYAHGFVI
jgi:hypothetical protein